MSKSSPFLNLSFMICIIISKSLEVSTERLSWFDTLKAFKKLTKEKDPDQPIFVSQDQKIFNSTVNSRLATLCRHANIPTISIHGLRHTHASLLLFQGVSVLSVSRRLGHANVTKILCNNFSTFSVRVLVISHYEFFIYSLY